MILHALTFELRILARKRRRLIKEHKVGLKKRLTFTLPAQEAEGGSELTPALGQVQINTQDFVSAFNVKSAIFESGFPTFVELLIFWEKPYEINLLKFPFSFFIRFFENLSLNRKSVHLTPQYSSFIYIGDLLTLIKIYKILYKNQFISDLSVLTQILGVCKSMNVIIYLFPFSDICDNLSYIFRYYPELCNLYQRDMSSFKIQDNDFNLKNFQITGTAKDYLFLKKNKKEIRKKKWYGVSK